MPAEFYKSIVSESIVFTVRNSSCGKVMFSQVSVCPRGEVYTPRQTSPSPLSADTPWADTPGRHTSPTDTPSADTPPGRHTPLGRHPQADTPLGRHLPGRHTPASDIWWPSLEPPADPPRWILQRTVGILLECILV